jgi:hypothetical protein
VSAVLPTFEPPKWSCKRRNSAAFRLHIEICAAVVVEGATVTSMRTGATTMLALGLLINTVGIGLFCWLIFTLAVYALPFSVALSAGTMAFDGGAGVIGAPIVGIAAGALTLAIGQTAFAMARSLILRAVIAAAFALPAAIAGYHVVLVMSQIGMPSLVWREVFAWAGAILVGATAWTRLTVFASPVPRSRAGWWRARPHEFSRSLPAKANPGRFV